MNKTSKQRDGRCALANPDNPKAGRDHCWHHDTTHPDAEYCCHCGNRRATTPVTGVGAPRLSDAEAQAVLRGMSELAWQAAEADLDGPTRDEFRASARAIRRLLDSAGYTESPAAPPPERAP